MNILSVSQVTRQINDKLEGAFPFVWVQGQVTNLSRPFSGHVYFSLKDENSMLAAVWFKNKRRESEKFDPLTGEIFEDGPKPDLSGTLSNGDEIACAGRISVYGPRGQYQLIVELAQEVGQGKLHAEFELLKAKLAARGFFDQSRKRPLPRHPARVALLTSPSGAALHDFIKVSRNKGFGAQLRLHPVPVQGAEAAPAIIKAIEEVNREGWAELIVIIRGGGSLEDLWAFNEEKLAEAVVKSRLPVLAGIGHEVDFSMTDLSADMRAATPSHAAQLLWPERREFAQKLDELHLRLERAGRNLLAGKNQTLLNLERALGWLSPKNRLERHQHSLERLRERLSLSASRVTREKLRRLEHAHSALERGFSIKDLRLRGQKLAVLQKRLERGGVEHLSGLSGKITLLDLRLEALSPLAPLERGYALLRKQGGEYVRSITQIQPGEQLEARVSDGEFSVSVEK